LLPPWGRGSVTDEERREALQVARRVRRRLVRRYGRELWLLCEDATVLVRRHLAARGIASCKVAGVFRLRDGGIEGHWWAELVDGTKIDVTATQFGRFPPVWFGADAARYATMRHEECQCVDVRPRAVDAGKCRA
jgi:hypothetical protein